MMLPTEISAGLKIVKWVSIGLGALIVVGVIWWAVSTVIGWKDDAAKLPGAIADKDKAIAAKAALDSATTKKFDLVFTRLNQIDAARNAADATAGSNQSKTALEAGQVKGAIAHAPRTSSGTIDTGFVAGCLRDQLAIPRPGAVTGACGRGGASGSHAGLPAAAAPLPAVPGRQPAGPGHNGRQGSLLLPVGPVVARHRARSRGRGRPALDAGRSREGDERSHRRLQRDAAERDGPSVSDGALRRHNVPHTSAFGPNGVFGLIAAGRIEDAVALMKLHARGARG